MTGCSSCGSLACGGCDGDPRQRLGQRLASSFIPLETPDDMIDMARQELQEASKKDDF